MSAETTYSRLVEQFKVDVENATKDALEKIHSEMVPYLNDDTESNARYRAVDIVKAIIRGEFEIEGNYITVDGWHIVGLSDLNYDKMVDILSAKAGDIAKDKKIERLERTIKEYEQSYWSSHMPSN
jgi:hypothetical protein